MGKTVNEDIKELKYVGKYFSNLGGEEVSLNISCKQETRPTKGLAAKVEIYTVREATNTAKDIMVLERYFNFSLTCKRKYPIIQRVMRKIEMPQRRIWKDTRKEKMGGQYKCGQRLKLTKTTGVESN